MKSFIKLLQNSKLVYTILYGFKPGLLPNPAAIMSRANYRHNSMVFKEAEVRPLGPGAGGSPEEGEPPVYIVRQNGGGPADGMRFGLSKMRHTGCEIMACCNAMRMMGKRPQLPALVSDFERRGASLMGFLGTAPAAIEDRLRKEGLKPEMHWASLYRKQAAGDDWDELFSKATCAVITFWWKDAAAIHTVALEHDRSAGGGLRAWNMHSDRDFEYYTSIAAMVKTTGIVPISLIAL